MIFEKKVLNTKLKYDTDEEKLYRFHKVQKKWTWVNPAKKYDQNYKQYILNSVNIDERKFYIHRLIYYLCNDDFDIFNTKIQLDHINGEHNDNRLENLRTCNNRENNQNKKHYRNKEVRGYSVKKNGTFQARYRLENGKQKSKCFKTEIEARNYFLENTIKF